MTINGLLHFGSTAGCIWTGSISFYCHLKPFVHFKINADYKAYILSIEFCVCHDSHGRVSAAAPYYIRGVATLSSTYSCLAVRDTAGPWLCLVSSPCCWRLSRSDCGGSGPPRGAQGSVLWEEGTGLPFSCSGLCPPWKSRGECVGRRHFNGLNIRRFVRMTY